jgi:hypothetical protein
MGPQIIKPVSRLITAPDEHDWTRLAALEAIDRWFGHIEEADLVSFSSLLYEPRLAAFKIELIKLLTKCRCVRALPAIRACLTDRSADERIDYFGHDETGDRVSDYAEAAINKLQEIA